MGDSGCYDLCKAAAEKEIVSGGDGAASPESRPDDAGASSGHAHGDEAESSWRSAFASILEDPGLCDVVFVVGGERLHALRHLCAVHSEVFGAQLVPSSTV